MTLCLVNLLIFLFCLLFSALVFHSKVRMGGPELMYTLRRLMMRHTIDQHIDGKPLVKLPAKHERVLTVTMTGEERAAYNRLCAAAKDACVNLLRSACLPPCASLHCMTLCALHCPLNDHSSLTSRAHHHSTSHRNAHAGIYKSPATSCARGRLPSWRRCSRSVARAQAACSRSHRAQARIFSPPQMRRQGRIAPRGAHRQKRRSNAIQRVRFASRRRWKIR